jgi:cation-transporting ATPase E
LRSFTVPPDGSDLPTGLTAAEVADRVARGQVNRPPSSGRAEYRGILLRNTLTLFNALVVPAAVALFLLEDYRGAWAVSGMAVANTLIGLAQEIRAKRHLDRLAILSETKAHVHRDGKEMTVPAGDVVLGDVVLLAEGEPVVADGAVLAASFLEVDEALLTGESDPVPRRPGDQLLSGSYCVAGRGDYRADRVGGESFAHRTSAQARRYRYAPSPIQQNLDALIRALTAAAVTLCLGYVGLYLLRGFPTTDLVQMIAATITSMVPQGLILMATLAFVLGAVRMARRGAVVQRLNAVEAMASVDVLALDKTGTLTTGRLSLDRVDALADGAREKLRLFAWATIDAGNKSVQALRDALGPHQGPFERLDQVPFKAQNRYSAVAVRTEGREMVLLLGAVESLKPFLSPTAFERVGKGWRELLPTGLRLMLFAEGDPGPPLAGSLAGQVLRPLALVALSDELRPEAGAVLESLAGQGIAFKILSGDHPETVRATVGHLDLPLAREPIVTGAELESAADPAAVIARSSVFGRVAPQQKLDIVSALQARGHRVAMLGDGVNDVLPIKRADLGVAMGAGSPAARTVAAVVLETNDFGLLPALLDEGRVIVNNLRRAAKLFLLKNVYTVLLVVVALGLLGLGFPYLPQQVTLLNALTIGGPALLIMASKAPPRPGPRPAFLREVGWYAVTAGLVTGVAALMVWLVSWGRGDEFKTQQTLLLTTLILAGLGNVLIAGEGERRLVIWAVLAVPVYAAVMYLPPTRFFFNLTPLAGSQWALAAGASAVAVAGCVLVGRPTSPARRRSGGSPAPAAGGPTPAGPAASASP